MLRAYDHQLDGFLLTSDICVRSSELPLISTADLKEPTKYNSLDE